MISRFLKSVSYALQGIALGIKEERNVRIDIVAMICVWRLSAFYSMSNTQLALLAVITFAIPAFELMNTAVERAVHKPDREHYMPAGAAKDAAAGGVFIMSVGAVIAGAFMFWDIDVFKNIFSYYTQNLLHGITLLLFAAAAYAFITIDNVKTKGK